MISRYIDIVTILAFAWSQALAYEGRVPGPGDPHRIAAAPTRFVGGYFRDQNDVLHTQRSAETIRQLQELTVSRGGAVRFGVVDPRFVPSAGRSFSIVAPDEQMASGILRAAWDIIETRHASVDIGHELAHTVPDQVPAGYRADWTSAVPAPSTVGAWTKPWPHVESGEDPMPATVAALARASFNGWEASWAPASRSFELRRGAVSLTSVLDPDTVGFSQRFIVTLIRRKAEGLPEIVWSERMLPAVLLDLLSVWTDSGAGSPPPSGTLVGRGGARARVSP